MTAIADMVSESTTDRLRELSGTRVLTSKRDNTRLLAMAAGKPGSPFSRDTAGRLRHNGRFVAVK